MVAVPEMIARRRLTFEDYQALPNDQDFEIVEGVLYVSPRPRPLHQIVAYRFTRTLDDLSAGTVVPDADLIIPGRDVYVSPDIMLFLGDRFSEVDPTGWIKIIPDLVVEVLSPGTDQYDQTTKKRTYAQLGVSHYWMVDPSRRSITECVLLESGEYRELTVTAPDVFRPALFPHLALDLARLLP